MKRTVYITVVSSKWIIAIAEKYKGAGYTPTQIEDTMDYAVQRDQRFMNQYKQICVNHETKTYGLHLHTLTDWQRDTVTFINNRKDLEWHTNLLSATLATT